MIRWNRAPRARLRRRITALLGAVVALGLVATPVFAAVPVANDQSESVRESKPLDVFLDASDDDFDTLAFVITNPPDHGSLTDCADGVCTYTPNSGYVGADSFQWHANDGTSDSNTATFSIDVTANNPPEASDQSASTSVDVPLSVFLDASDIDNDDLAFAIVSPPTHGALDDCSSGFCTYTPNSGYSGPDSFTWKANDGLADSNVATFTITVVVPTVTTVTRDAAGAAALATAMVRDPGQLTSAAFVAVPPNGTPNGTSVALGGFPTNGSTFAVLTSGDASLADDPNDNEGSGEDDGGANVRGDSDFDVTVLRLDLTAPASANCLRIDLKFFSEEYPEFVGSFNDAFIAELDASTWTTSGQDITAPDNFAFDATGDVISVNSSGATSMSAADAAGTTYDGATVLLRAAHEVTPGAHSLYLSIFDQGDHVLDSAIFLDDVRFVTVQDPAVDCAEGAEIPTNDPPVAVDDTATTAFETPTTISVKANDSDPDGDAISVTGATDPAHGTTLVNADGTVTYAPDAGFSGTDTFEYTISDGHGHTDTATVTVTVGAAGNNPAPTSDAGGPYTGTEGSATSLDGTVTNEPGTDTVSQTWSYTLGAGTDAGMTCAFGNANAVDTTITCTDDGTVTVKLTVSDGVNGAVEDTATLTIGNADPVVSITSPADGASFGVGATVNVSATISDAGTNDSHTCSIDWGDGTVTTGVVAAGTCTGSHSYSGIAAPSIVVTVTDDDGGSGSDEVLITVSAATTTVTGGGWITADGLRVRFGFVAQPADPFEGELQLRWGTHRFHGTTVTSLVAETTTASWTGSGRYDGAAGYTFSVVVVDNGNGAGKKKTHDTFAIEIRDASGTLVYSASGSLGGGNIKVH
jgi:Bacterial Ig domain